MGKKREPWNPLLCSYPDSEKVNSISLEAETLYTRLLARSDDNANYDGSPKRLLCKLYALRYENKTMTETKVLRMRNELVTVKLLKLYIVDGKEYVHIVNCKKQLRSDIKPDFRFPQFLNGQEVIESVTDSLRTRDEIVSSTTTTDTTTTTNTNTVKHLDFVFLTPEELDKLNKRYGQPAINSLIEELNTGIGSKGYKYESHYFTLLNWAKRQGIKKLPTLEQQRQKHEEGLRRKQEEIRKEEGGFLRTKTIEQLEAMAKDPKRITRHWLIKEIIAEKQKS